MKKIKKQNLFFISCGAGIVFSLGMYFFTSSEQLQANIFESPSEVSDQYQSIALEEILPGVHEGASDEIQKKKPNIVLKGSVNKTEAAAGEEVVYAITIHNRDDVRYDNVQATVLFPFDFLDFIEAKGLTNIDSQNQTMTFAKSSLAAGEIWIINIRAKIQENVSGNMRIANAVTVSADGADLTELYDYSETKIVPKPQPKILVTSGGMTFSISLFFIGCFSLLFSLRRRNVCLEK